MIFRLIGESRAYRKFRNELNAALPEDKKHKV